MSNQKQPQKFTTEILLKEVFKILVAVTASVLTSCFCLLAITVTVDVMWRIVGV